MNKEILRNPVPSGNGEYKFEEVELNSITAVVTQLTAEKLGYLLAIVQFQQRISKLFFDDEEKYEKFFDESEKALKEYLKIKEPSDSDLKKSERIVAKLLEQYCDMNGKSLVYEVAKRLCKNYQLKSIVE